MRALEGKGLPGTSTVKRISDRLYGSLLCPGAKRRASGFSVYVLLDGLGWPSRALLPNLPSPRRAQLPGCRGLWVGVGVDFGDPAPPLALHVSFLPLHYLTGDWLGGQDGRPCLFWKDSLSTSYAKENSKQHRVCVFSPHLLRVCCV